jgi:hypothetical protein
MIGGGAGYCTPAWDAVLVHSLRLFVGSASTFASHIRGLCGWGGWGAVLQASWH